MPKRNTDIEMRISKIMLECLRMRRRGICDVFIDYSPHVDWVDIRFYLDGWKKCKELDFEMRVHVTEHRVGSCLDFCSIEDVENKISSILNLYKEKTIKDLEL